MALPALPSTHRWVYGEAALETDGDVAPDGTGTVWDAWDGGSQITDLYDEAGEATTVAVVSGGSVRPLGVPTSVTAVFVDFGEGRFVLSNPHAVEDAVTLATSAQTAAATAQAAAETAAASVGSGVYVPLTGDKTIAGAATFTSPVTVAPATGSQHAPTLAQMQAGDATVLAEATTEVTEVADRVTTLEGRGRIWVIEQGAADPAGVSEGDIIAELAVTSVTYLSEHDFDSQAGANTAAVVAGDTGLAASPQATIVKSPGTPIRGTGSIRTSGTATRINGTTEVTAVPDVRVSAWIRFDSLAIDSTSKDLMRMRNPTLGLNGVGIRLMGTTGVWTLVNNATAIGSPSSRAPVAGETWRVEWTVDLATRVAHLWLWHPGNTTATADEHLSHDNAGVDFAMTAAQGAERINFGLLNAVASSPDIVWDDVRWSRASEPAHPVST